ncbi:MAG TPA: sulfotransferase [Rhizomicrobium sp.]
MASRAEVASDRSDRPLLGARLGRAVAALDNQNAGLAERLAREHLAERPGDTAGAVLLANALVALDRQSEAESVLAREVEVSPDNAALRHRYASLLLVRNKGREALVQANALLAKSPANDAYRGAKAAALENLGEWAAAAVERKELLDRAGRQPSPWLAYASTLRMAGRMPDCITAYRRAAELFPGLGEAWWGLASIKTFRFADADIVLLREQLARPNVPFESRAQMHFALGKALSDRELYGEAFEEYRKGNALIRSVIDYDADANSAQVARFKSFFTPEFFGARKGSGCQSPEPIFVVGLPRAGSTLVEQILASHSMVEATMELRDLIHMADAIDRRLPGRGSSSERYPEGLASLDRDQLEALGNQYLDRTSGYRHRGRPRFVDKLPANFSRVGLIELILPNARIIDVRRHPVASCLSNYVHYFALGKNFSYGLTDLGRYYRDYVELMAHFDGVLPGRVHRVFYERLIADPESEIRAMLDYLGLPFEESCVHFHETDRTVLTISAEQVREPIYTHAQTAWRTYEPWLAPLKSALGPVLDQYPGIPDFGDAPAYEIDKEDGRDRNLWFELQIARQPDIRRADAGDDGEPECREDQTAESGNLSTKAAATSRAAPAQKSDRPLLHPFLRPAVASLRENRPEAAEELIRSFLEDHPDDVNALDMLSDAEERLGLVEDATATLARCIELAPDLAPVRYRFVKLLIASHRHGEAVEQLDVLLKADPGNVSYLNFRAYISGMLGDYAGALGCHERLIRRRPDDPNVWLAYSGDLRAAGRQQEAIAACKKAIGLAPGFGNAWWTLANFKTLRFEPVDIERIEFQLRQPNVVQQDRCGLHFSLGKAFEDEKHYAESFGQYSEGNRLQRETTPLDLGRTAELFEALKEVFTPDLCGPRAGTGWASRDAIFIVGLPRSGSTLIEQILASHSAIEGTIELPHVTSLIQRVGGYPRGIETLDRHAIALMGRDYIDWTAAYRRLGRPYFTDKMSKNMLHVGLIHLMLPNARIIDVRRHPLAAGFSNFKHHFGRHNLFSNDLRVFGRYYRMYVDLMNHYDRVLPGKIHRVVYESMVSDPEREIRALLAYLELPFEDGCLRFYENDRAVRTSSSEQVRRPITAEAVEQWRHYEPWLGPLKESLGEVLETYADRAYV